MPTTRSDSLGTLDPEWAWSELPWGVRRAGLVWRRGAWRMVVGSPAWSDMYGQPEQPGWEIDPDTRRPWDAPKGSLDLPRSVEDATAETSETAVSDDGQDAMTTEYANDPDLGVVPVGQVTDQDAASTAWRLPARLVAKVLPVGPVDPAVGRIMGWLPWAVWGLVGWWVWKRTNR